LYYLKIDVNGKQTSPVFSLIKAKLPGGDVGWNFEKVCWISLVLNVVTYLFVRVQFLFDKQGNPVKRYKSGWTNDVVDDIEKLLADAKL
jgi:glutathione peroxidase-family protein